MASVKKIVSYIYINLKSYRWITFIKSLSFSTNFSASHTNCRDKCRFTSDNTRESIIHYWGIVRDNPFQYRGSETLPNRPRICHVITAATYKNQHSLLANSSLWQQKDTDPHARIFTNLVTWIQGFWPNVKGCENNHTVQIPSVTTWPNTTANCWVIWLSDTCTKQTKTL